MHLPMPRRRRGAKPSVGVPIAITPPGLFNFLGLPSELRNRIYWLILSQGDDVDYQEVDTCGDTQVWDVPIIQILPGINILRVCRQIYKEAVMFAYAHRRWALGTAPIVSLREYAVDCGPRLICIPDGTDEKVQHLGLILVIEMDSATSLIASVTMGDFTKLKSLRSLELRVMLDLRGDHAPRWLRRGRDEYRYSPFLLGLVCQIISQVPVQIEITWLSTVQDYQSEGTVVFEPDKDIQHIAHEFGAIQGCRCATETSSGTST
jgi:hypothetical protein